MAKFITSIEELPLQQQHSIRKRLQELRDSTNTILKDSPTLFQRYYADAIKECEDSMLKMVAESSRMGAVLDNISYIYVIHKERKNDLERLKKEYLDGQQQPQNLSPEPQLIPKELSTPEAKKVLQRGITAGLLNDKYQPQKGIIRAQQKEFADLASLLLNIQKKWVVFGALWSVNNLGQVKTSYADVEKLKSVRKLFPELGFDANGVDIKNKKEKFR